MPAELHLLRPLWLLALIPLAFLLWRLARRGEGGDAWRGVVDAHLLSHLLEDDGTRARRRPLSLLALGWLTAVIALAGPVWERLPQPLYQTDAQRVILLDLSLSMNAADLPPSRLARARFEVLDLLERAAEGQTALLAYGAEPFVVSPLTRDAETIAAQVPNLESALLPVQGDRRADLALERAGELLRQAGAAEGDIILITDGLDRPAASLEEARRLRDRGYRVSVLGVGTEQGAPVPRQGGGFATDEGGAIRMPRLQREELIALTEAGGGRYLTAGTGDEDTLALIPDEVGRLGRQAAEPGVKADQWREEGPGVLLALLPLAALAFRRGWLSPLLLLVLLVPHPPAQAVAWQDLWQDLWLRPDQQAAHRFAAGEHEQAAQRFMRPDWRAAAHYQAGDFESALQDLEGLRDREATYNRGNALTRMGKLEDAIAQYEQVLESDPSHEDARHNLDLLRRLLADRQPPPQQPQGQPPEGRDGAGQPQGGNQDRREPEGGSGDQAGAGESGQQDQSGQGRSEPRPEDGPDRRNTGSNQEVDGDQAEQEAAGGDSAPGNREQADFSPPSADGTQSGEPPESPSAAGSPQPRGEGGDRRDAASAAGDSGDLDPESDAQPLAGSEPGREDLLGGGPQREPRSAAPVPRDLAGGEESQAMEHLLRRVPDDPGGLLRQRFLLQHLRRSGQLP